MFVEEREACKFSWQDLGDPELGRPNLGQSVPVLVYRLMQYTLRDVMITELGVEATNRIVYEAGKLAGEHFCRNLLDTDLPFEEFVAALQRVLREQKIGVLRVERADLDALDMVLTVAEDLDCSGLPVTGEVICVYDEGFIAGVLYAYTGKMFHVKEVDCWATGDRTCRFQVQLAGA
jgi:uncharacterized protein